jgi:hypothetical protein
MEHFPIQGPPKFIPIGIFGLEINHLATLIRDAIPCIFKLQGRST